MVKTLYMEINIVKQLFGHSILHVMYGEDVRGGVIALVQKCHDHFVFAMHFTVAGKRLLRTMLCSALLCLRLS